ncbi:uncharacterized protein F4822DRAFT_194136 [Hypoxylon trugodes]|uniref:uncharacterized protein n=1 Tax=Hypoxylon trugodes TaxID=326681 RepID=UPI00219429C3|nr:uncharacterized protein F4822DRAFT_194136 [Hypoxylon trugodes]KAI1382525.1 hypothetical protein F4822DRAFT_194136 [Hypoxylon trugodes]
MVMSVLNFEKHVSIHELCVCSVCDKLISTRQRRDHYNQHDYEVCSFCIEPLERSALKNHVLAFHCCPICENEYAKVLPHLAQAHEWQFCDYCNEATIHEHVRDANYHSSVSCPLCSRTIDFESIEPHLATHNWQACRECNSNEDDFLEHVGKYHPAKPCPICGRLMIETGRVLHLYVEHELQRCPSCPIEGIDDDHVQNDHQWKECQICFQQLQEERLSDHLYSIHSWSKCNICGLPAADAEEHNHRLRQCPECSLDIAEEQFFAHLSTQHRHKQCPFCEDTGTIEELRHHIQEFHNQTEKCAVCGIYETTTGLSHHLLTEHLWQRCEFCGEIHSELAVGEHIQQHDPQQCPDCHLLQPASSMNSHRITAHSYETCPFCHVLSQEVQDHIFTYHRLPDVPIASDDPERGNEYRAKTLESRLLERLQSLVDRIQSIQQTNYPPGLQEIFHESQEILDQSQGVITRLQHSASNEPIVVETEDLPISQSPARTVNRTVDLAPPGEESSQRRARSTRRGIMEEPQDLQPTANSKKRRATTTNLRSKRPKKSNPSPDIFSMQSLLKALEDKEILLAFFQVVRTMKAGLSWKEYSQIQNENRLHRVSRFGALSDTFEHKSHVTRLLKELGLVLMAGELDSTKDQNARLRADPDEIQKILSFQGRNCNPKNRQRLNDQIRRGRKLRDICEPYPGLLCFICLDNRFEKYISQSTAQMQPLLPAFHEQLSKHKPQLEGAGQFLTSIQNGDFKEYVFENWREDELQEVTDLGILQNLLRPFRVVEENIHLPSQSLPRKASIRRPDSIPSIERQCDLCDHCTVERLCHCISTCFASEPEIADCGALGRGLKAVGPDTVYPKDTRIGQITGRFELPGRYQDGWALEITIPYTMKAIHLYTREEGNLFRLINHSCRPSADLVLEKISGKWRAIVKAKRDIFCDEAITIDWGLQSLPANTLCLCESCSYVL